MRYALDIEHPDKQISNRMGSTHKPCPVEEYAEYGRFMSLTDSEKAAYYHDEEMKRRAVDEQMNNAF